MNKLSLRKFVFWLFILPGVPFILVSIVLLIYIYWPVDVSGVTIAKLKTSTRHVTILVHGLRDSPESWVKPVAEVLRNNRAYNVNTEIFPLSWDPFAKSTFRCSVDGKRIGEVLAHSLADNQELSSLHLVGHSCGSFVVFGLCSAIKEIRPDIKVQSTYLDPVSIYGGLFRQYGLQNFGACADFSEAYIDREDGVPGSDQPQPYAHTFDVTDARKTISFTKFSHTWPYHYYEKLAKTERLLDLRFNAKLTEQYPPGELSHILTVPSL